jgi:predicted RNase H-like HicB family nuclease
MRQRFTVVIERGAENDGAYVPDVPGCIATSATVEETRARLVAALTVHLAVMAEYGEPLPEPATTLRTV